MYFRAKVHSNGVQRYNFSAKPTNISKKSCNFAAEFKKIGMQDIRNIAIIAHVDHGKTTLVDKMMLAGNLFREGQNLSNQVLDANDLERERGITILSKNVSINWKGTKINIIDTPGHSDFGGEVERVLNMADGCLLLVDAFEGPMPQTRFVLQKALQIGLKPIVVVNKVDKPNCRPEEVYEMVFDLMFSLNATEDQLDFPVVYGSAKNGWMSEDWQKPTDNITYLLDKIVEVIPAPKQIEGTPQMLITYSCAKADRGYATDADYLARLFELSGTYRRGSRASRYVEGWHAGNDSPSRRLDGEDQD